MLKLNINEIFASINGEVNKWSQGSPTVFVRLQGCNLDPPCSYCDTNYAQSTGDYNPMTIKHLLIEIESFGIKRVTITGGEPLLQKNIYELIRNLLSRDYQVSVETNGSIEINKDWFNWKNLSWVVDYKSEFETKMNFENYYELNYQDWIKFVIQDKSSFSNAVQVKNRLQQNGCCTNFAFSPADADPVLSGNIVQWLIENKIDDVILNLQIHKIIQVK